MDEYEHTELTELMELPRLDVDVDVDAGVAVARFDSTDESPRYIGCEAMF